MKMTEQERIELIKSITEGLATDKTFGEVIRKIKFQEGKIDVNGRVSALLELTAGFDPDFTGRENIYFRGQLMGISNEEIKKLENDIVEFADIGDFIRNKVKWYYKNMVK